MNGMISNVFPIDSSLSSPLPAPSGKASTPGHRPKAFASPISLLDGTIAEYYPSLLSTYHACLSVFGAMSIADRTKPLALILEARSGFGKTAVAQMFIPSDESPLAEYVYRSDDFTPKAFVSHHSNRKKGELETIDLLPRLDNKVLITKELAPLFRGREEQVSDNFSKLISVLDGKGYTTDSGSHGQRGYRRDILFNWIGCTTPLPPSIHAMMSQLGTRLLFWDTPCIEPSEADLLQFLQDNRSKEAEVICQSVTEAFLLDFFQAHPPKSNESVQVDEKYSKAIARWAKFLCAARAEIKSEKNGTNWEPVAANDAEGPWKVANYFFDIARGHALICGRDYIDLSDLLIVEKIAISSVPAYLRPLVKELRKGLIVTNSTVQDVCACSEATATNYLKQAAMLKLGTRTHKPGVILHDQYEWMTIT